MHQYEFYAPMLDIDESFSIASEATLHLAAIKLRKSSSFRQGSPEPRLHGWHRLLASLQSGFRRSMPE